MPVCLATGNIEDHRSLTPDEGKSTQAASCASSTWGGWVKVLYPVVGASEPRAHIQGCSFSYPCNCFLIGRDMLPSLAMNETQYKSLNLLKIG